MSFFYPRTIQITRPQSDRTFGATGYHGQVLPDESVVATDVPAAIQAKGLSGPPAPHLPGDARRTVWRILIPQAAIGEWIITTRDIVTDDAGVRYQVLSPYLTSLGYQLTTDRLES